MIDDDRFIPGIYNYCDRWCERCRLTSRCRVAAEEAARFGEDRPADAEDFQRQLNEILESARSMLLEIAEEFGLDLEASAAETNAARAREEEFVGRQELPKLAERYAQEIDDTLNTCEEWLIFAPLDEEAQAELLEIIRWYQFFIAGKIRHGMHGLLDADGHFLEKELKDSQSDANGSIKIALIAVERSLAAWAALFSEENAATLAPHLALLETIRRTAERAFPHARDFIRPGFDELETVM